MNGTLWFGLAQQIIGFATVVVTLVTTFRKTRKQLDIFRQDEKKQLDDIHNVVNSRLDAALTKIDTLEEQVRLLRELQQATIRNPSIGGHS
jgi:hypothetical protein